MAKRWIFRDVSYIQRGTLADALAISPVTAAVLLARGVRTETQARDWLTPHLVLPPDPFLLPDMERAVDRLHQAVRTRERVCFYGDYDVDGMAAASLYLSFFRRLGVDASVYIPHRVKEGYGLHEHAIQAIRRQGVRLVVTSDCGTTAHREVASAARLGMEVVVTDHHQAGETLPPALAVLNPCRTDSRYPFRGLCSAGLAFKVIQAYQQKFGYAASLPDPAAMLDLVALATVADVVPLHDENRLYVKEGLALMTRGSRCGLRALKIVAGVERSCTAGIVAFRLVPRLNAAGRLAHADLGVRLLTTDSESEAGELAESLDRLNRERQRMEESAMIGAVAMVEPEPPGDAIVVWSPDWHVGVVGIMAARLVERFHRPAVVIALNGRGVGRGSVRSVPGVDVHRALACCRDLLEGFGGHPSAAGLTIRFAQLDPFRRRFAEAVGMQAGVESAGPLLHVDTEVRLDEVNARLVQELEMLHPFGAGNPEPTLAVRSVSVVRSRVVGVNHLKMTVRHGGSAFFDSIGFRMGALADHGIETDEPVDLAFVPELNRWNGQDRVQLRLRDLRPSRAA